jgi:hypothetical protein
VENRQFRTRRLPPKLRYGLPICGDLVVEPLFEERILPLASPAFFKEHRPETSGRPPDSEQRQRRAVAGLVLEVHQLACAGAIPGTVRQGANVTRRGYAGFGLALESTTIGGLHLKASSSSIGQLHVTRRERKSATCSSFFSSYRTSAYRTDCALAPTVRFWPAEFGLQPNSANNAHTLAISHPTFAAACAFSLGIGNISTRRQAHTLNAPDRQAPTTAPSQKPSFCMSNAIMAATNTKMLPTKMPLDVLAMT